MARKGALKDLKKLRTSKNSCSGKKKAYTRQNIIACDENRRILLVSPTKGGRVHDIKQFKKWQLGESIPTHLTLWGDKGFTGVGQSLRHECPMLIPQKKPRGKELTPEQRQDNKVISGLRMVVEHANGRHKEIWLIVKRLSQ